MVDVEEWCMTGEPVTDSEGVDTVDPDMTWRDRLRKTVGGVIGLIVLILVATIISIFVMGAMWVLGLHRVFNRLMFLAVGFFPGYVVLLELLERVEAEDFLP
ncbi:hypothetical protein BRD17_09935 [Halobacteriales archaeon SW_7_68_16]|nr:MAG: hypothetical protein BRD17_09935 [Halobacteriales archaeon SW_7_68_16]